MRSPWASAGPGLPGTMSITAAPTTPASRECLASEPFGMRGM